MRVLAVGIDAAEPTLVRELIDRGEMPVLRALLDRGRWALVDSRGDVGDAAVWPTFFTGSDPAVHQLYSRWCWEPDAMGCGSLDESSLTPFWRSLQPEVTTGVIDVPWGPIGTGTNGFEVSELGSHEVRHGRMRAHGAAAESVLAGAPRHPFHDLPYGRGCADDAEGRRRLAAACVQGAGVRGEMAAELIEAVRPQVAIVVFSEAHHGAHQLWHTTGARSSMYADIADEPAVKPDLLDVYREIDRQVGRVVEAAGAETAVMAFSLNGIKPGRGVPTLLHRLLRELRFAAPGAWRSQSRRERAAAMFGALKRRVPAGAKVLYRRRASQATRRRLARPTIVPSHDWSRTRAFALPITCHRGHVRVNLAGREARGCVPEHEYAATCEELESALRSATNAQGEPIVADVLRTASETGGPPQRLPDLVVQWEHAASARPVRVVAGGAEFESHPIRTDMTGVHTRHGFCIIDERMDDGSADDVVHGSDLHRLLLAPLGADAGQQATAWTGS